jgi:hypothetical protein
MTKFDTSTSPQATATSTPQAKASEASTDSNKQPSLSPDQITLPTFRHLLSRYPKTVEQVHQRKVTLKLRPKAKSTKRKAKDTDSTTQKELDPPQEEHIRSETEKFIQLDKWRYEEMPSTIAERRASAKSEGEVSLSKEELISIMEWKLYVPPPLSFPGSE